MRMIRNVLVSWFAWPDGGVWSNLAAALLWAGPGFTTHHVLMRRYNVRILRQETRRQTEELKNHLDARLGGKQP
jgi:hypothetical protein